MSKYEDIEIDIVKYHQAVGLKEIGFDKLCLACYPYLQKIAVFAEKSNSNDMGYYAAPTYSQAFRWFRKNYPLLFFDLLRPSYIPQWVYIVVIDGFYYNLNQYAFEEAQSVLLDKLIQLVKENDKDKWKLN